MKSKRMQRGGKPAPDPWDNPRLPEGFRFPHPPRDLDPGFSPPPGWGNPFHGGQGNGPIFTDAPDILGPGVRHVQPGDPRIGQKAGLASHPVLGVAKVLMGKGFDPHTALKAAAAAWLQHQQPQQNPGWPSMSGYGQHGEGWQAQVADGGPDPYMQGQGQGQDILGMLGIS